MTLVPVDAGNYMTYVVVVATPSIGPPFPPRLLVRSPYSMIDGYAMKQLCAALKKEMHKAVNQGLGRLELSPRGGLHNDLSYIFKDGKAVTMSN